MKTTLLLLFSLSIFISFGQVPVNMQAQNRFTFTEDFSGINNWAVGTVSGTYTTGAGSQHWKGLPAGGSGTIPNGTRITAATTSFSASETSGGLHRINESLVLLSTGTTDNTSAAAIDLYLDFTGLNAGLLSFDWASINNSAGNRKGSLRVYASIDNISFTEITAAQVLNFTNNSATAGEIKHIALPSFFNNAPSAILRFYYNNGVGGTTGSRPKLGIDNLNITAVPSTICAMPTAQPTHIVFGNVTPVSIQGSFSAAPVSADSYLVLASINSTLNELPENLKTYSIGDNIDDAIVVSTNGTSFTATGLNNSTQYHFFAFSYNAVCSGGPLYLLGSPLTGSTSTTAGNLPCEAPLQSPADLVLSNISTSSISGNFTPVSKTDGYLILRSQASVLSVNPVNSIQYLPGDTLGNAVVVSSNATASFVNNNLEPGTTYYYFIFGYNSEFCNGGPVYKLQNPLSGNATTTALQPCNQPSSQPTNILVSPNNIFITGTFDAAANADYYLIVFSTDPSLNAAPVNGTSYAVGTAFGNGIVAANSAATAFRINNLLPGTTYYIFVFAQNKWCSNGPIYIANAPLSTQATTTTAPAYNYYFGNLHAHSRYSDGNKDNSSFTPADNFAYAKNSLCMDFLGISEHNHAGAGMNKSNWLPGYTQAQAATSTNFLALFGMEWGVISSGGHVLVYGVDKLVGWEANNYDQYVAKSDYTGTPQTTGTTGLFRFLNNWGNNSFAILAHPGSSDFNALTQVNYNATADSAVVGTTIESGPAFSTNTTYSNPAASMSYLSYYKRMLAKGYKVGPNIDHDNHYTTFGRTTNSRLAVIAPTLQQTDFFSAMRRRNFYATQDCDTRISLTLNNEIMGSELSGSVAPAITVNVTDPTNTTATATIKILKGIPGSGVDASEVFSQLGNNVSFTDNDLQPMTTGYYYADITMAGARSITAPIWYTRNGGSVLSAQLLSFEAVKTNTPSVIVSWKVSKEETTAFYKIERSLNGVQFDVLQTVQVFPNGDGSYKILDLNPAHGLNYYRLNITGKDGRMSYSKVVTINFKDATEFTFQVYPNPVGNIVQMNIQAPEQAKAMVQVQDMYGRILTTGSFQLQKGAQRIPVNIASLAAGTYFISMHVNGSRIAKKIVKQ